MNVPSVVLPGNNPLTAIIDVGGVWRETYFIGLTIIVSFLVFQFRQKRHTWDVILDKLLLLYVLVYSLFMFEHPNTRFGAYSTAYQLTAAQSFVETCIVLVTAMYCRGYIIHLLLYVVGFELVCIWLGYGGLLLAPSFDLAFCALAATLLPPYVWWLVLFTCLTHHGSTALLILAAQLLAVTIRYKDKKYLILFILSVLGLLSVAYFHSHGPLLDGTERLQKYTQYMKFWAAKPEWIIFGVGPGSFMWTSLLIDDFKTNAFLQMHSDWLQILWEYGVVGFTLMVTVFIGAVKRAHKSEWGAIFGCAAFGLTYHPLRFFPSALLIAVIFVSCKKESYLIINGNSL